MAVRDECRILSVTMEGVGELAPKGHPREDTSRIDIGMLTVLFALNWAGADNRDYDSEGPNNSDYMGAIRQGWRYFQKRRKWFLNRVRYRRG